MRFREKLLVLFVAVILSVLGFYLISSSFAELYVLAKEADNDQADGHPAECGDVDHFMQFTCLNYYDSTSCFSRALGASK